MPKDGYVCAPMLGPGMARPVMPRHHRGSIHWRRGGRRRGRVRLSTRCHPLTVMFSRTPSAGAGKVLAAPDPQGLWPGRHQSLRVQGGRRAGARSRQSRRMRRYECAHDALSDIDRCSDAEILARLNDSLHAARAETEGRQDVVVEIPRGYPQLVWTASRDKVTYLVKAPAGVLAGSRCARTCDGMARRTHRDNRRACKRRNVSSASGMSASSGNG